MKSQATYDDARLILELYDLRREERLRAARKWMGSTFAAPPTAEEFTKKYPPGSDENAYFRMVVTYWDMAASFVVAGIIHRELFIRSNNMELLYVWEKIKTLVPELRQRNKNPLTYSNIEKVAGWFIEFLNENAPEAYGTFSAGIAKPMKAANT